ncbi:hypothetical protein JCM14076_20570 [Methylosoma difficile]
MSHATSSIDNWLAGFGSTENSQDIWDPGFDGERRLVISSLGVYKRVFARPQNFTPLFFHRIYPLLIENWQLSFDTPLYGGFCTLTAELHIIFQATIAFAKRNIEAAPDFNAHIKAHFQGLVEDIVRAELLKINDCQWLENGLAATEKQIAAAINEILITRAIQCRTHCLLKPTFAELTETSGIDERFSHSAVYLQVMKKNFEFRQQKDAELFMQQEASEKRRVEHQQALLEVINWEAELERKKQILAAEASQRELEQQKSLNIEQFAIQYGLHRDQVDHENELKAYEQQKAAELLKGQQLIQQQTELDMQAKQLEHDLLLKKKQREAELQCFEQNRLQLLQAKEQEEQIKQLEIQAKLKEEEIQEIERLKLEERLEAEKINHQARIMEMQMAAEMQALEIRAEATQNKDKFLRREIEWLVLDKQRAELTRAIKAANQDIQKLDEGNVKRML